MDYYLADVIMACESIIQKQVHELLAEEKNKIKDASKEELRRIKAGKEENTARYKELCQKEAQLDGKVVHIYLEYLSGEQISDNSARVTFHKSNFVIYINKSLLVNSLNADGSYNENIQNLMNNIAHEVGHITLHYRALINMRGTQGSAEIKDSRDTEADIFSNELIKLRKHRISRMLKNGNISNYFSFPDDYITK